MYYKVTLKITYPKILGTLCINIILLFFRIILKIKINANMGTGLKWRALFGNIVASKVAILNFFKS
jgi:hypothetical protein